MNKKSLLSMGLLLLVLLPVFAAAAVADKPLASVNGEPVSPADYRRYLLKLSPGTSSDMVDKAILKSLIEEKLILQEARKRGVSASDAEVDESVKDFLARNKMTEKEFEQRIASQGMSVGDYRRWLKEDIVVLAKMLDQEVGRKVTVSTEELRDYYWRNRELYRSGPERLRVKAIFLRLGENPSLAEVTAIKMKSLRLISELRSGVNFDILASQYPENTLMTREGVFGEFRKGELVPELDGMLASMKEGDISPPVWLKEGVYILKLEKRIQEYTPFEEAQEEIRQKIYNEKRQKVYNEWVKALWDRSAITIY